MDFNGVDRFQYQHWYLRYWYMDLLSIRWICEGSPKPSVFTARFCLRCNSWCQTVCYDLENVPPAPQPQPQLSYPSTSGLIYRGQVMLEEWLASGRGVRQADALTGSDTEARTALQQRLYLCFFPYLAFLSRLNGWFPAGSSQRGAFYWVQTLYSRSPLQYLCLLLCVFLLEIIAGVLAYITYQEVKKRRVHLRCDVTELWLVLARVRPTLPTEAHIFFHNVPFHSFLLGVYLNSFFTT